jgi:hypothetical protein
MFVIAVLAILAAAFLIWFIGRSAEEMGRKIGEAWIEHVKHNSDHLLAWMFGVKGAKGPWQTEPPASPSAIPPDEASAPVEDPTITNGFSKKLENHEPAGFPMGLLLQLLPGLTRRSLERLRWKL